MACDPADKYLRPFPELSHAQIDSMATLAATMLPSHGTGVKQTYTKEGGTHLYVYLPKGREFHIAKSGKTAELGVPHPSIKELVKNRAKVRT